jgi:hypothetical protein
MSYLELRTWDLREMVSPNFHALNNWDCTDWPQVTRDLGLGDMREMVSPNLHALNGWDCTYWPQVTWDLGLELGLGTRVEWYVPTSMLSIDEIAPGRSLPLIFCIHVRSGPIYWGGYLPCKKIIRWWYFTCKKPEDIICDGILHVNMFHYFKIPYFTCNVFTKFTYNEYIGPYFLSHVVLRFSPSDLPEEIARIDLKWLGTWDLREVVSPHFHALNGWDCMDWPQVTWGLGT